MPRIGLIHTGLRADEKLLIKALKKRQVDYELIDIRQTPLNPDDLTFWEKFDVILERCISTARGNAAIEFLSNTGRQIVNNKDIVAICNDKFQTASVLSANKVPVIRSILVSDESQASKAIESLGGYPVVMKSREGSWGRLMGKINDEDALEAAIAHRRHLSPRHNVFILQEYIDKKENRDIRAFVINGECICAIYRTSSHWITNTAKGGEVSNCPVTDELLEICENSSNAIGGGILAIDLIETTEGLVVNEVNHTMEFKNSEEPTGVSISGAITDYLLTQTK